MPGGARGPNLRQGLLGNGDATKVETKEANSMKMTLKERSLLGLFARGGTKDVASKLSGRGLTIGRRVLVPSTEYRGT